MKSVSIFFHSIIEIKEFVDIVSNMKGRVMLSDKRYSVDAKSVMGVYCLNLSEMLQLEIENWEEKYELLLAKYIVRYNGYIW